jgi:hypothetical protein
MVGEGEKATAERGEGNAESRRRTVDDGYKSRQSAGD